GSAIIGPERTSCTVMGVRKIASSLSEALSRAETAISASCSIEVPNSYMCRRAAIAYLLMIECPYGASYSCGPIDHQLRLAVRRPLLRSERAVEPYVRSTTSARPCAIASAACAAITSQDAPPTVVESTQ